MKEFDYQFLFLFMQKNERMQGNDRIKNESFLCNDVFFLDVFCNLFFLADPCFSKCVVFKEYNYF